MTVNERQTLTRLADLHSAYTNNTVGFIASWFDVPSLKALCKLGFVERHKPFPQKPGHVRYRITPAGREALAC